MSLWKSIALTMGFLLALAGCAADSTTVEADESSLNTAAASAGDDATSENDSANDDANTAESDAGATRDSSDSESNQSDASDSTSDSSDSDSGDDVSFEDLIRRSPLQEFLGRDFTDSDAMQDDFARREAEAELATVECMQELGFEYKPRDVSGDIIIFGTGAGDGPEWFSDEWVEKFGLGITTMRFPQSMVGPDLVGFPDEQMRPPSDETSEDPNQEYVDGLSDGARDAYYAALYGDQPDFGDAPPSSPEEMEAVMADFVPSGCANEARDELFNGGQDGFYTTFADELDQLYERIEADPRVVAHRTEVSRCLADKGQNVDVSDMRNIYEIFESDLAGIGGFGMFSDPFADAGLDPESMTEAEIQDFLTNVEPPRLSEDDAAKLGVLQEREFALASALLECDGGPLNDEIFLGDIRFEYEERFLAENAEALAPFKGDG